MKIPGICFFGLDLIRKYDFGWTNLYFIRKTEDVSGSGTLRLSGRRDKFDTERDLF